MPDSGRLKKRLRKLHAVNPHCYYCGIETVLADKDKIRYNTSTIEHLNSRWDIDKRWQPNPNREIRTVLACYSCNIKQGKLKQDQVPEFIQKLKAGGGGILDAMPVENLTIKEALAFLEKYAKLYRCKLHGYIVELMRELEPCTEKECLFIIKDEIKSHLLIDDFESKHRNHFLLQFLPKNYDFEQIKNIIHENFSLLKQNNFGHTMKVFMDYFQNQLINVDGNIVYKIVRDIYGN